MNQLVSLATAVLFGLLFLLLTACGGGGGSSGDNTTFDDEETGTPIIQTISRLNEYLTPSLVAKGPLMHFYWPWQRILIDQIVTAGIADRLTIEGIVVDGIGGIEIPANIPSNNFPKAANVDREEIDLDRLRKSGIAIGVNGLGAICVLAKKGFSADQIIEGLVLGTIVREEKQILQPSGIYKQETVYTIDGKGPEGTPSDVTY